MSLGEGGGRGGSSNDQPAADFNPRVLFVLKDHPVVLTHIIDDVFSLLKEIYALLTISYVLNFHQ